MYKAQKNISDILFAHNSLNRRKIRETGLNRSACIMFESNCACQHCTDGSDPARMKWLVEENSKGTRWEWVAERSSLLGCENGHLHRGGPAPHLSPASTTEWLTGRQCTVKQKNTGRRWWQSAKQWSLTKSSSVLPCGAHTPAPPRSLSLAGIVMALVFLKLKISQQCSRGSTRNPELYQVTKFPI